MRNIFLTLATLLLLGAEYCPHHHHNDTVLACFENDATDADNHAGDSEDTCPLKANLIALRSDQGANIVTICAPQSLPAAGIICSTNTDSHLTGKEIVYFLGQKEFVFRDVPHSPFGLRAPPAV